MSLDEESAKDATRTEVLAVALTGKRIKHSQSSFSPEAFSSLRMSKTKLIGHQRPTAVLLATLSVFVAVALQQQQHAAAALETNSEQAAFSSYLLFATKSNASEDPNLNDLLKDKNHHHVNNNVDLKMANLAWLRMHDNAKEFARQRVELARPTVSRLLEQANTSLACKQSIGDILDRIENLDDWAVRMYNAFGDLIPSGFFEGTWNSMGDYYQCVNLERNKWIGEPQFCVYKFQPLLPKRPRFHSILSKIDNLANFTTKEDMFRGFAEKSHYFYYSKLNVATCMPSKCDRNDLDKLGEQIALNSYLQFQGIQCQEKKAEFNPDGAQIFALIVLISLASVSLVGTLVHIIDLKSILVGPSSTSTSRDLNNGGHLSRNGNQIALLPQQQQCKTSMLPKPVTEQSRRDLNGCSRTMVTVVEVLLHFSILSNARKLFDTRTSRRDVNSSSRPQRTSEMLKDIPVVDGGSNEPNGDDNVTADDLLADETRPASDGDDSDPDASKQQSNDISCVHGMRFWTISWIIFGHTMLYTEWAGFGRAYQIEEHITSLILHPFFNASFSVDTFFLISGLLTTYVTWTATCGQYRRFSKLGFLVSRYLRLTPQVLLVMLMFIVFPLAGEGPYWSGLIKKESENCKKNWWVSALYLQSFIRQDQICNLVTWWLSIEMFFHFISIVIIIALLHGTRKGLFATAILGGGMTAISCYLHYANEYPPNMFPTLIQRYEIWDDIVLKYFWTPFPHAPAYFTGLLLGYVLYSRSISRLSPRVVRLGWLFCTVCFVSILLGTYEWNKNAPYTRLVATVYFNAAQICWPLATGWIILACALGHGGWLNSLLSSPVFVPLGRATYMTYLSHMLVIMAYPAKMNLLIEPSYVVFIYIYISDLILSYILGIILTLVYESPILHMQKILVARLTASRLNRLEMKKQQRG